MHSIDDCVYFDIDLRDDIKLCLRRKTILQTYPWIARFDSGMIEVSAYVNALVQQAIYENEHEMVILSIIFVCSAVMILL